MVDVPWNGFSQSRKIGDLAEVYQLNVAPHNYYSHLASFISASLCAVLPNVRHHGNRHRRRALERRPRHGSANHRRRTHGRSRRAGLGHGHCRRSPPGASLATGAPTGLTAGREVLPCEEPSCSPTNRCGSTSSTGSFPSRRSFLRNSMTTSTGAQTTYLRKRATPGTTFCPGCRKSKGSSRTRTSPARSRGYSASTIICIRIGTAIATRREATVQRMHMDGWNRRHHHTRWAMAFYYPQPTPIRLGPTGVVPGSHYNNTYNAEASEELPLYGDAGDVTIVHYDLWHRAMPNSSEGPRYMMKFLFARNAGTGHPELAARRIRGCRARWLEPHGRTRVAVEPHVGLAPWTSSRGAALTRRWPQAHGTWTTAHENTALNAAYRLARIGTPAIPPLTDVLDDGSESARRNAAYALSAIGAPAVPDMVERLGDDTAQTVEILADIGGGAEEAVPGLVDTLETRRPGNPPVVRGSARKCRCWGSGSGFRIEEAYAGYRRRRASHRRIGPGQTGSGSRIRRSRAQ